MALSGHFAIFANNINQIGQALAKKVLIPTAVPYLRKLFTTPLSQRLKNVYSLLYANIYSLLYPTSSGGQDFSPKKDENFPSERLRAKNKKIISWRSAAWADR